MPLFKTGHQPKTHMASEFRIEAQDRQIYDDSKNDNISQDEKDVRTAIAKWAKLKQPDFNVAWIYSWNAGWKAPK